MHADPSGTERLNLAGEVAVQGTTTRALLIGSTTWPKGTEVRVSETWLLRRGAGSPPGYRVTGSYDPAVRSDGFVLPRDSIDIYLHSQIVAQPGVMIAVPAEYFRRRP